MDFIRVTTPPPPSRFPDPEADPEFWKAYFRFPRHDVAEGVMTLRRLRGLSQAELAHRVGTQQPAIARIEAARANIGLDTLRALAVALDAVVHVEMSPAENCLRGRVLGSHAAVLATPQVLQVSADEQRVSWIAGDSIELSAVPTDAAGSANDNFALSA
jgi:transcriptional regulator with XRE-family HTH domain